MSSQVVGPPPVPPPTAPPLPPERQLSGEFVDVELGNVSSTVVDVDRLRAHAPPVPPPSAPPVPPETMNPPPRRQLTGEFVDVELGNAGLSTVRRRRRQRTTARSADDEDGLCSMVCAAVIVVIFMVAIVMLLNKYWCPRIQQGYNWCRDLTKSWQQTDYSIHFASDGEYSKLNTKCCCQNLRLEEDPDLLLSDFESLTCGSTG
uniref:Uncharacterized protein n=1 Tax=Oryza nivara TaxID=4536 RepID=A0A0E0IZ79_ORYNI